MRYEVRTKMQENYDYVIFLRENPIWYRILTRNPERLSDFLQEYRIARKLTFTDRVDRVSSIIQMVSLLLD